VKILGVYTKNFSLYYDILTALKKRNLSYVVLSSPDKIPRRVGVVLTSKKENIKSKAIFVDNYPSIEHAIDFALQKLVGKELYSKVFIGIDPGERPGLAIVGDDILLQKRQLDSPEKVALAIKHFLDLYPSKEVFIRIGHGSTISRNRIINSIIPLNIPIEIVDETSTSASQRRFERDSEAAAIIAMTSGGKVKYAFPLEPSRGAIKDVQKRSRQLTEGKFTIPEETAIKVLKGEMGLLEAIEKEKRPKCL
jgi:hypothetical protein